MCSRRTRFATITLFVLAGAASTLFAQTSDVERVIALGKSDSRVMEHLDHLSNRIGPRLTSSDNFDTACQWTLEQFQAFGLANCHLEVWGEFPVGFNRGPASGRMTAPETKELHFGTSAWSAGTKGLVSGLVVIAPTNDSELNEVKSKLAGAWVLAPASTPRTGTGGGGPARTNRPSQAAPVDAGAPSAGAEAGRAAPAADARAFREKLDKAYDEAGIAGTIRATRNELILTGGSSKVDFLKLPTRPSINLLATEYKEIQERVKKGEEVRLEFDIRNWFEKGPIPLNNVIAEIVGSEKPEEVVIVGGHLDTWDGATGATDNGTGCATTMEAARLLVKAGVQPKRTIRFMLWGGEEQGLLGSAAYVKAHKAEMDKISAVLVHDGGTNYCAGITATAAMKTTLESVFAPVTNLDPEMPFQVREVKGLSGGGSDHSSFLSANVPGFFWSQKGRANYNHTHHTQFDTYDQAIPEYQRNSAIVIAVGALGIANLPALLSREKLRAPEGAGGGRRLGVQLADETMVIDEIVEGGLAAMAGLMAKDRIVKVGGKAVADNGEMRAALTDGPAKTNVTVMRGDKEIQVDIEFAGGNSADAIAARRLGVRFGDKLVVDVVTPGGLGDQAHLQSGDEIVKLGATKVATQAELSRAFGEASGPVDLVVRRDGKEVKLSLTLPEPAPR